MKAERRSDSSPAAFSLSAASRPAEEPLRLLCLTRYTELGASSRCRVYQYLPRLAQHGIRAEIVPWMPPAAELWRRARAVDAVLLQKRVPTLAKLLLLRQCARVLLFDFDDAIWLSRRRSQVVTPASARTRLRLAAALRLSDQVIAGNEYLAAFARRWNPRVAVLPTPIDGEYYVTPSPPPPLAPSARLRLGWVGHASNLCYLRRLEPALVALARRYDGLSLCVICSEPYECTVIPVENVPWSLAEEVANLRRLDIGLMPLEDDPWTRGKCGYKALQYMAVGIPVVCSPVGMNRQIVDAEMTGLVAEDLAAWERQLARLIDSAELRLRLGAAGQRAALAEYSVDLMAPRLANLLRSSVAAKAGTGCRGARC